jgi:hypothetical protein
MHASAAATDLPQQLPTFLWQAELLVAKEFTGASQQLCSLPLLQTSRLVKAVVCIIAHPSCVTAHKMSWEWAELLLQQLLKRAVTAGLMQAVPGGCVPAAAVAARLAHSSSGSGMQRWSVEDVGRVVCMNIRASAEAIFDAARRQHSSSKSADGDKLQLFLSQPVVAELALQLLASHCTLMHKRLAQWQQQQQLVLRQQGRRVRGYLQLLRLPFDLQQHIKQLLPAEAMTEVIADVVAKPKSYHAIDGVAAGAQDTNGLVEMHSLVAMLHLNVTSIAESTSDGSISSPALSAAALQLSAVLLLLAAAEWQRQWCALTVQQQELLKAGTAALDEAHVHEVLELRQQLAPASALLKQSCQLLQQQTQVLCEGSQWQPSLQLLQQGGGEVLLQGLTLAVHCISADCGLQDNDDLRYFRLLEVLSPRLGA